MRNVNILQSICEAVEMIVQRRLSDAEFNTTKRGTIVNVLDESKGEYQVRWQDANIKAYSPNNARYEKDTLVYFLNVNNSSQEYFILGGVEHSITEYNSVNSPEDMYNTVGVNLVNGSIEMSSYENTTHVLYDYWEENNVVTVDQLKAHIYIQDANAVVFGANFRTNFADTQMGGNYGLKFYLAFASLDSTSQSAETIKCFIVDTRNVIGNPYALTKGSATKVLYNNLNSDKFLRIDRILAFTENFPSDLTKVDIKDIFLTNLLINSVNVLTQEELNGYSVHIDYSETGNVLEKEKILTISLTALLKIKGKLVTSDVDYYWFKENATIIPGASKFSTFAGRGWECLNPFPLNGRVPTKGGNTIQFTCDKDSESDWVFYTGERKTNVRCVAVYKDTTWVNGDGKVVNNSPLVDVNIISSDLLDNGQNKTTYYLDAGSPTLKCAIVGDYEADRLSFSWVVTPNKSSPVQVVPITELELVEREVVINNYNLAMEVILRAAAVNKTDVTEYYADVISAYNNLKPNYLYKDTYYNFLIKDIVNSTKITCTVTYLNEDNLEKFLGTGNITLENLYLVLGSYNLNILNGSQVFQYDAKGNSPTSPTLEKPLLLLPLTFTLYDNTTKEISHDQIINNGYIKWYLPKSLSGNTMLLNANDPDITPAASNDDYDIYLNLSSFAYAIADQYDRKKKQNDIKLLIKYKLLVFSMFTNFTFSKNGDPGTNGTDYVAKIVPSTNADRVYLSYFNKGSLSKVVFVFDDTGEKVDNLKFLLYNNSRIIEDLTPSFILWKSGVTGQDSFLTFAQNSSNPQYILIKNNNNITQNIEEFYPVNIYRATYHGDLDYYAEFPIVIDYLNKADYRFKISPKTGYQYVIYKLDGTSPSYDNTLPFEVYVEKYLSFGEENFYIRQSEGFTYEWESRGNLKPPVLDSQNPNIATIEPNDTFDGLDLTSAILVKIKLQGEDVGYIYIPIYMMINRYNHAALNGWDGNSVDIGKNGLTILTPQIGAGVKNQDNTFTGIFMGDIHRDAYTDDLGNEILEAKLVGLMAYSKGERTIFLDADSGKAEFGRNGDGQIIIDPDDHAKIYGGNYVPAGQGTSGSGMLIDLSLPSIKFGTEDFMVGPDGSTTATSGYIGGWQIKENYLTNGAVGLGLHTISKTRFNTENDITAKIWGGSNNYLSFAVDNAGRIYSRAGKIGGWDIGANSLSSTGITIASNGNIKSNNFSGTTKGWSINSDGKAVFNDIETNGGKIKTATIQNANIEKVTGGDLKINNATITNGTIGGVYLSNNSIYGLNNSFVITPNYAKFTGLYIDSSGVHTANSSGTPYTGVGGNGMGWNGSGAPYVNTDNVKPSPSSTQTLTDHIKELAVNSLNVSSNLVFQGTTCKWREVEVITNVHVAKNILTHAVHDVFLDSKKLFILTGLQNAKLNTPAGEETQ